MIADLTGIKAELKFIREKLEEKVLGLSVIWRFFNCCHS